MRIKYVLVILVCCLINSTIAEGGDNQVFTFSFTDNYSNGYALQYSIWIEKATGDHVNTCYVTYKTAKKGIGDTWPFALPVWAHRHGGDYGGSIYPTIDDPLPDAISTASPYGGSIVKAWEPTENLLPGEYYFYIEINKAFDTNDSYTTGNGQPSVIWRGSITIGTENSSASASISGHGHETGNDGTIYTDVSLLTNALVYISNVGLTYTAPTTGKVVAPVFAPASGTYSTPQDVTLSCTTGGATIYYTTEGSDPTDLSMEYTAPITVAATTTIKAKAYKTGWNASDIASGAYTIHPWMLGDCNDNGRIDIGDAVILINYLLELGLPPDPLGRGDCNQNGRIDIGDVVMIINYLLSGTPIDTHMLAQHDLKGDIPKISVDTPETVTQVIVSHVDKKITLDVESDIAVAGVFIKIGYDSDRFSIGTPTLSQRCKGMKLEYNMIDNEINAIIYSLEGNRIKPGIGSLLSIPVQPQEGSNYIDALGLTIDDISLSDIEGRLVPVEGLNISTSLDSYDREALLDMEFKLEQNYPNPFNPETILHFTLPTAKDNNYVLLRIYNLQGQLVRTLINAPKSAGSHTVVWDGRNDYGEFVSTGVYLYNLQSGDYTFTRKMTFMK